MYRAAVLGSRLIGSDECVVQIGVHIRLCGLLRLSVLVRVFFDDLYGLREEVEGGNFQGRKMLVIELAVVVVAVDRAQEWQVVNADDDGSGFLRQCNDSALVVDLAGVL